MAQLHLAGIGASQGIGDGCATLYRSPQDPVRPGADNALSALLPAGERDAEIERLRQALTAAGAQLEELNAEISTRIGAPEGAVFEAQALFLQDPALLAPIEAAILGQGRSAQYALAEVLEAAAQDLDALDDEYLRARAADLRDVMQRVLRLLDGLSAADPLGLSDGIVLIAHDLTPSETVGLQREHVRGIVLAAGAPMAHAAILARGLGIPLVVGVGSAIWQIAPGQPLILDGSDGTVLVEPDADERATYQQRANARSQVAALQRNLPAITKDGRRLALLANASSVGEARLALDNGAEGIGLLRTEFLLAALPALASDPPTEDMLADAYGAIMALMGKRPVVVRVMDAGGDKPLPFLDFGQETNPFLGWRGIRILLDQPDLFASQIRALLRAADRHRSDLRLLFPMVSSVEEFVRARALVETVSQGEKFSLAHPLRIGVMIEVPSAALIADALAREADFFSLGTNDLVQYTLACDRTNARVGHLYQVLHPAVLRLLDMVVRAAHTAGRTVGVCGEAAGDAMALPLLLGLGVDELSVSAALLPEVRRQIRTQEYERLQPLAADACAASTVQEVMELLELRS